MAIIVTTTDDVVDSGDGFLSLREAVAQANGTAADTIRFASEIEGQTLMLTAGELVLREDLTIDGDWNNDGTEVTINGNANRSESSDTAAAGPTSRSGT